MKEAIAEVKISVPFAHFFFFLYVQTVSVWTPLYLVQLSPASFKVMSIREIV